MQAHEEAWKRSFLSTMQPWHMSNPCLVQPLQAFLAGRWEEMIPVCAPLDHACTLAWASGKLRGRDRIAHKLCPAASMQPAMSMPAAHSDSVRVAAVPLLCQAPKVCSQLAAQPAAQTAKPPPQSACGILHGPAPTVPCHSHLVSGCRLQSALALACRQVLALAESASPHS